MIVELKLKEMWLALLQNAKYVEKICAINVLDTKQIQWVIIEKCIVKNAGNLELNIV